MKQGTRRALHHQKRHSEAPALEKEALAGLYTGKKRHSEAATPQRKALGGTGNGKKCTRRPLHHKKRHLEAPAPERKALGGP